MSDPRVNVKLFKASIAIRVFGALGIFMLTYKTFGIFMLTFRRTTQ